MALRKTLFKYRLQQDQDLFDEAFGYIRDVALQLRTAR
jgi:type I restriction enzyme, R subunit